MRKAGRLTALVAWMRARPGTVLVTSTQARADAIVQQFPDMAGRVRPVPAPSPRPDHDWMRRAFEQDQP